MTRPDNPWFRRTFQSGKKRSLDMNPKITDPVQLAHLVERCHALAEAVTIARAYEKKGADAGTVRLALNARFTTAYNELVAAKGGALEESPDVEAGGLLERNPGHPPVGVSLDERTGSEQARPQNGLSPAAGPLTYDEALVAVDRWAALVRREFGVPITSRLTDDFPHIDVEPQSLDAHRNLKAVE